MHGGLLQPKMGTLVLGHSLVSSLVHSHRSPIRLLRTARFTLALRSTHSLAHGKEDYASITYNLNPLCKGSYNALKFALFCFVMRLPVWEKNTHCSFIFPPMEVERHRVLYWSKIDERTWTNGYVLRRENKELRFEHLETTYITISSHVHVHLAGMLLC